MFRQIWELKDVRLLYSRSCVDRKCFIIVVTECRGFKYCGLNIFKLIRVIELGEWLCLLSFNVEVQVKFIL